MSISIFRITAANYFSKITLALAAFAIFAIGANYAHSRNLTLVDDGGETATCNFTELSINPETGDATAQVTDLENPDCAGSTTVSDPPQPSIGINNFSIVQGNDLSITYSTDNATSCTAGGNFPAWSGSKQLGSNIQEEFPTDSVLTQSYTINISCTNSAGTGSDSANFQVISSGTEPNDCPADRQPPNGMVRATSCLIFEPGKNCQSYAAVFGGVPGATGIRQFAVDPNRYAAMAFSLPDGVPSGANAVINARELQGSPIPKGNVIWSISTCPGDFNVDAISQELDSACVKSGFLAQNGFAFGGSSFTGDSDVCALPGTPDQTFYLNILYTEDNPNTTPSTELEWSCNGDTNGPCGAQLQVTDPRGW